MVARLSKVDAISFDDVLLKPEYGTVYSRKDISTFTRLVSGKFISVPIISANMDTVTEATMANKLSQIGAIGAIHRFMTVEEQLNQLQSVTKGYKIFSVGVKQNTLNDVLLAYDRFGADLIVLIDIAHGHSERVVDLISNIRKVNSDISIIAGNVATYEGAFDLATAGANGIKIGVGPGAACSTRSVTGCGVPQLTAIIEGCRALDDFTRNNPQAVRPTLIADGGIKTSGDIVKALAAGADSVMIGSLLAGTDEAPGEVITLNNKEFKTYRGMASRSAQKTIGVERTPEGVEALVPCKGSVSSVIQTLIDGVRSGMSYLNCYSIDELHEKPIDFIRITQAGKHESHTHVFDFGVSVEV